MPSNVEALRTAILALPYEEKARLMDELLESVMDDVPPAIREAQVAEVERRRNEYLAGKTELIPGEQVMREMRALLNEISRVPPTGSQ